MSGGRTERCTNYCNKGRNTLCKTRRRDAKRNSDIAGGICFAGPAKFTKTRRSLHPAFIKQSRSFDEACGRLAFPSATLAVDCWGRDVGPPLLKWLYEKNWCSMSTWLQSPSGISPGLFGSNGAHELWEDAPRVPRWYAVFTLARHEKRVFAQCEQRQIESFLPLYKVKHRWKNRCTVDLELPLFPSYSFVRIDARERVPRRSVAGVTALGAPAGIGVLHPMLGGSWPSSNWWWHSRSLALPCSGAQI